MNLVWFPSSRVVQYFAALDSGQPTRVLCLYLIGETGNNYLGMWKKPAAGNQSLALTYRELWTITHRAKTDTLTLWKFAKCYGRTSELARITNFGGVPDAYAIYRENNGSLLHSDKANPMGELLMIAPGSSDTFKQEIRKQQNEHAVPIL